MSEQILSVFPIHMREKLKKTLETTRVEELRVRVNRPFVLRTQAQDYFWDIQSGQCITSPGQAYFITEKDISDMLTFLSRYSIYAYEEELKSGYLTLEGGHRVGVAGHVLMENGHVGKMSRITFLNIRIAQEYKGCAEQIYPYLLKHDRMYHTLLLSAAGIGKTTYLRDLIRLLATGDGQHAPLRVGVVDERSEIAAGYMGIPQHDVGIHTDVMDGCSKPCGMLMLLRSMAPQVIAVDELGGEADFLAVEQVLNCGCSILGTIHAADINEMMQKTRLKGWLEQEIFERFIVLEYGEKNCRKISVYDEKLEQLC
ncbi:MAG: stage III sporulation protein AA [Lachnospiraceae bacterium]|nr:stage III sporulation protein AA [Lachnospiraceae bacterium]